MLTFIQFIEEIVKRDLTIPPTDVQQMRERFWEKVLKMGHLQDDGSMLVPVDCVLEAAQSVGTQTLTEAAEILRNNEMVNMLHSGEILVEQVAQVRERKLRELIRKFQSESNETNANREWKQIEKWSSAWTTPIKPCRTLTGSTFLHNSAIIYGNGCANARSPKTIW